MKHVTLCGVRIDDTTLAQAVAFALKKREAPCWVVTPNAVMLDACRRDPRLARLLNGASLSLADGMGVMLAARRRGTPLRERVAGIDFGEALTERACAEGLRVFLLGGREGVAASAAERLCARYPNLIICGVQDGYFEKSGAENTRVLATIRESRADILFVCFGFPLQERWIFDHLPQLREVRVIAGLGGSLDVWSGNLRRAPKPVSRMGLEWAWRMLKEPKRLKNLPAIVQFMING